MKTTLLLLFAVLLSAFTGADPTWEAAKLGDQVSFKLPSVPELETGQGMQGYRVHNGRTAFTASATDLVLPEAEKLTAYDKRVILMGAEKGALHQSGGEALTSAACKVGTTEGRDISFRTTDPESGRTFINHLRFFIVGRKVYSFHCWYPEDDTEAAQDKDTFFQSVSIAS